VRQHVQRTFVAEPLVEVHREHDEVRGGQSTGVVADQKAPARRNPLQFKDFRAVIDLHHRTQQIHHVTGERSVETADLFCRLSLVPLPLHRG